MTSVRALCSLFSAIIFIIAHWDSTYTEADCQDYCVLTIFNFKVYTEKVVRAHIVETSVISTCEDVEL